MASIDQNGRASLGSSGRNTEKSRGLSPGRNPVGFPHQTVTQLRISPSILDCAVLSTPILVGLSRHSGFMLVVSILTPGGHEVENAIGNPISLLMPSVLAVNNSTLPVLGVIFCRDIRALLMVFIQSVERLINRAYQTIASHPVNEVDQIQINTFFRRPGLAVLDQMEEHGIRLLDQSVDRLPDSYSNSRPDSRPDLQHILKTLEDRLDQACLALSIALLDRPLKGELLDSTPVGFLAILGINSDYSSYYTTYLSTLVKMAQILVAERAVGMADEGQSVARLMPLRRCNTTTSLGYIYWSGDEQTLSYKELQLSMKGFRQFTSTQIQLSHDELEQLFLLHPEEIREEIIPSLPLRELQDHD
ncbi:hypothetical protein OAory_01095280 [Aspergillus oryzae]|uniref:Uncharacterized protein n=1 Tax=Aspergillus oryzae TaxID=5062 RepID=A0A1S9D479_ASPOZ|nr:hypothetical protein OAory_01095280 [Aspergillus oryzae]